MSHVKQTSKRKRSSKALPVLGAAGLSFSLANGTSGAPAMHMPAFLKSMRHHHFCVSKSRYLWRKRHKRSETSLPNLYGPPWDDFWERMIPRPGLFPPRIVPIPVQ